MLTCPNCGYYVSLAPRLQRELEAEIAALRADIERHIAIASEHATECERLRAALTTVAQAAVDAEANGDAKSTLAEIYRHVMATLAEKG